MSIVYYGFLDDKAESLLAIRAQSASAFPSPGTPRFHTAQSQCPTLRGYVAHRRVVECRSRLEGRCMRDCCFGWRYRFCGLWIVLLLRLRGRTRQEYVAVLRSDCRVRCGVRQRPTLHQRRRTHLVLQRRERFRRQRVGLQRFVDIRNISQWC